MLNVRTSLMKILKNVLCVKYILLYWGLILTFIKKKYLFINTTFINLYYVVQMWIVINLKLDSCAAVYSLCLVNEN